MNTVIRCTIDYIVSFENVFSLSDVVGRNMDEALRDALSSVQLPEELVVPAGTIETLREGGWEWDSYYYGLTKKLESGARLEIHFRAEIPGSDEWLLEPEEDAVRAMIPKLQAAA